MLRSLKILDLAQVQFPECGLRASGVSRFKSQGLSILFQAQPRNGVTCLNERASAVAVQILAAILHVEPFSMVPCEVGAVPRARTFSLHFLALVAWSMV